VRCCELDLPLVQSQPVASAGDLLEPPVGVRDRAVGAHERDAFSQPIERKLQ
jgi:hypothetical protein